MQSKAAPSPIGGRLTDYSDPHPAYACRARLGRQYLHRVLGDTSLCRALLSAHCVYCKPSCAHDAGSGLGSSGNAISHHAHVALCFARDAIGTGSMAHAHACGNAPFRLLHMPCESGYCSVLAELCAVPCAASLTPFPTLRAVALPLGSCRIGTIPIQPPLPTSNTVPIISYYGLSVKEMPGV